MITFVLIFLVIVVLTKQILILDLTLPLRLGEERMRQIPQRERVLGSGGAQEPRSVELHQSSLPHEFEPKSRCQVISRISLLTDPFLQTKLLLSFEPRFKKNISRHQSSKTT